MIVSAEELVKLNNQRKESGWYTLATEWEKPATYAVFDGGEILILYIKGHLALYHKSRISKNFKIVQVDFLQESIANLTKGKLLVVSESKAICSFAINRLRSVSIPLH